MKTIYVLFGGLMECPEYKWSVWGEGEGETLAECVRDYINRNYYVDRGCGQYVHFHDDGEVTDWDMSLSLKKLYNEDGEPIHPGTQLAK